MGRPHRNARPVPGGLVQGKIVDPGCHLDHAPDVEQRQANQGKPARKIGLEIITAAADDDASGFSCPIR
jgi:hypothetical protein